LRAADPADASGIDAGTYPVFEFTAGGRKARIRVLLERIDDNTLRGGEPNVSEETVNVRYMVDDVDSAVSLYTTQLGFDLVSSAAPAFADVRRGPLRLLLSGLLPGPASTQLAFFCAWRLRGRASALLGGICFIIPGLVRLSPRLAPQPRPRSDPDLCSSCLVLRITRTRDSAREPKKELGTRHSCSRPSR
jgi:hypothetical protein